jgi:hypothetical protein
MVVPKAPRSSSLAQWNNAYGFSVCIIKKTWKHGPEIETLFRDTFLLPLYRMVPKLGLNFSPRIRPAETQILNKITNIYVDE